MRDSFLIIDAVNAALKAGQAILEIYDTDFEVELKADESPLTTADKRSHEIIKSALSVYSLPAISEEGRYLPFEERKAWERLWVVDPLDGTKEFVKRNGEFTVNIALVEKEQPVIGVVFAPVPDLLYFAARPLGAFKVRAPIHAALGMEGGRDPDRALAKLVEGAEKLPAESVNRRNYTIVGSRSHATPELAEFVEQKKREKGQVEFIQAGSSLKICLVAEGTADIYPRMGPTMEWDTAAGQAVAECAGARMLDYESGQPLVYNKPDLLNPWFVVDRLKADSCATEYDHISGRK